MINADGWRVVAKQVDDRAVLHVTRRGYHVAYCASPDEVAEHVDLSTLVKEVEPCAPTS